MGIVGHIASHFIYKRYKPSQKFIDIFNLTRAYIGIFVGSWLLTI